MGVCFSVSRTFLRNPHRLSLVGDQHHFSSSEGLTGLCYVSICDLARLTLLSHSIAQVHSVEPNKLELEYQPGHLLDM